MNFNIKMNNPPKSAVGIKLLLMNFTFLLTVFPNNIPSVLTQLGACFITLHQNGELRGCIGSIYPTKPLIL